MLLVLSPRKIDVHGHGLWLRGWQARRQGLSLTERYVVY